MTRRTSVCLVAGLAVLMAGALRAAYVDGDRRQRPEVPIVRPRPVPPLPRPVPAPSNPLTEMVRRLDVAEGYHYRGLTVFLVNTSHVTDPRDYLSTEQALAGGVLTVKEKGGGSVPTLIVENTGGEPILMLGGEVLLGGKQNRVLRDDVLLPARSGPVEAPVLCIEQGRWRGRAATFESAKSVAPLAVRGAVQAGRSQGEVWNGVRDYQARARVISATGDLQAVHDSPEVRKTLEDYGEQFAKHCWRPKAVGMVVARYGTIVGADLFGNAALFRKHRDRLLDSYAVDCMFCREKAEWRWIEPPTRRQAEGFLQRVFRAAYTWRDSPGMGRLLSAQGAGLNGTALVRDDDVLHAALFPEAVFIIRRPPRPVPPPRPLPMPRPIPER